MAVPVVALTCGRDREPLPATQCAAVTSTLGATSAAPQKWEPEESRSDAK